MNPVIIFEKPICQMGQCVVNTGLSKIRNLKAMFYKGTNFSAKKE